MNGTKSLQIVKKELAMLLLAGGTSAPGRYVHIHTSGGSMSQRYHVSFYQSEGNAANNEDCVPYKDGKNILLYFLSGESKGKKEVKQNHPYNAMQSLSPRIANATSTPRQKFVRLLVSSSPRSTGFKAFGVFVILFAFLGEFRSAPNDPASSSSSSSTTTHGNEPVAFQAPTDQALAPGELPGYTGWARPERTLARFFSVTSTLSSVVQSTGSHSHNAKGYNEYVIRVRCAGHRDCFGKGKYRRDSNINSKNDSSGGPSLFYLRAYGPAVISGTVAARSCSNSDAMGGADSVENSSDAGGADSGCTYEFRFDFYDPGLYTIEAVLTFSNPPPISIFPLSEDANEQEPHYEGYLLPGFPLLANVVLDGDGQSPDGDGSQPLCSLEDLTETSPTSAREKARWKVTGRVNGRGYSSDTMNSPIVSRVGYQNNINALGIRMEYRHTNDCRILPESFFRDEARHELFQGKSCGNGPKKIHIVYIGDSVLRVQKDVLQNLLKTMSNDRTGLDFDFDFDFDFEFSFLSLHGGYRKNQALGPADLQSFLRELQQTTEATADGEKDVKIAVLFNTGLHDIHRLCGSEFKDERPSYLDENSLAAGTFACVNEYKALLREFLETMSEYPAVLKVFQTTTSAWPKYGNFGIDWSVHPQDMPLVSDFSALFNKVAFDLLEDHRGKGTNDGNRIDIMDGYWITHPRPDNREIGDIGKKLSHPGVEVLSTMARMWLMLIRERVCQKS
eukprot:jgi/Psemu1/290602/fgenesh1_pg.523_\